MNIAIIFAGGIGSRMGQTEIPKQFMKIDNKPILIHTLEKFQVNSNIDYIIISMLEEWIPHTKDLINKFNITKVHRVVPGGETGQMSIFNGIECAYKSFPSESTVLIHDGVRPFITQKLIDSNIETVAKKKSAISAVKAIETFLITDDNDVVIEVPKREHSIIAKAPQSFILEDVYSAHKTAQKEGLRSFIDSSTLMHYYGYPINIVYTDYNNIKITTPKDIELGNSIYEKILGDKNDK